LVGETDPNPEEFGIRCELALKFVGLTRQESLDLSTLEVVRMNLPIIHVDNIVWENSEIVDSFFFELENPVLILEVDNLDFGHFLRDFF
jgi:hypothetical protein